MPVPQRHILQLKRRRPRQGGFNFTEVLFAVMILGIGFIMVAAIFPVALSQSKTTVEETAASTIARGGVGYLETSIPRGSMPPTGAGAFSRGVVVAPSPLAMTALWNGIKQNLVLPGDGRYGAVVLYRRNGTTADPSPYAQVFVLPTVIRNQSTYASYDPSVTLQPQQVTIDLANNRVTVTAGAADAVAEGSFLIIADDGLTGAQEGWMNGRIFRIGNPDADTAAANDWLLATGSEFLRDPGPNGLLETGAGTDDVDALGGAIGFVVGRGYDDPAAAGSPLQGLAQDVAAYTTFINVR
jgi:hypothetical protein